MMLNSETSGHDRAKHAAGDVLSRFDLALHNAVLHNIF